MTTLADYHQAGILTTLETEALELRYPDWPNTTRKLSGRQIMLATGLSRTTIRDRIANGLRKIAAHETIAA